MSQVRDHTSANVESSKVALYNVLQSCHGRNDAKSSKELALRVTERTGEKISSSAIRDLVAEVRRDFDLPVTGCTQGYYVIDSPDDLERIINRINDTIETKRTHKQELTQAYNVRNL